MISGQVRTEAGAVGAIGESTKPRRRRFSISEKQRIVEASQAPNASVAGVALAHGINSNLLFKWKRLHAKGSLGRRRPIARLIPVQITEPTAAEIATAGEATREASSIQLQDTQTAVLRTSVPGAIHIQLPTAQLRIEGPADAATLRAVLEMLRG